MSFLPGIVFPGVGHGNCWCGVMAGVIRLLVPLLGWVVIQRNVFRLCWSYGMGFSGWCPCLIGVD